MANQQAKRDDNWQPVIMGETDDASRETSPLVVDPVTKRLKTTTTGSVTITETVPTDTTKLNPSLNITESILGTVTTKTLTKTIGSTSYIKTVESDSSDNSVVVSTWSQV